MTNEDTTTTEREQALEDLRHVRNEARYKVMGSGRIRDTERESVRCKYLRVIVQACNAERRLLKDRELEELAERVEAIEEQANERTVLEAR